jgi:poly(A) polymerase
VEEPRIIPRAEHPISRRQIDRNALKVLYRLHRAGFKSYVVGGGVRDLMLGRAPKDFDIATDARPQQIRRLFRNSRIIGRRFRLAHIFFREGIIEVSTFRRDPDPERQRFGPDDPLITDDNTFGNPRQDAFRRDFTVNALFYDISDYSVIDYVDGVNDLEQRLIRTIGDADMRFQEDPVRMARACEFAGRLDFDIEPRTRQSILEHGPHVDRAAPARLTEEVVQLMRCGAAERAMRWMLDVELLDVILPEVHPMVDPGGGCCSELGGMLSAVDRATAHNRQLSDATLLSVLLLPAVTLRMREHLAAHEGRLSRNDQVHLIADVVDPFALRFALSRDRTERTRQALLALPKLEEGQWRGASRVQFANRPYFPDALALLELKVEATGRGAEELEQWKQAARHRSDERARPRGRRRKRPRRRRRRRRNH